MTEQYSAYCVKCKTKRNMLNPEAVYTKTGTPGTQGVCEVCGTKLFRMGATPAHEGLAKPDVVARTTKNKSTKTKSKSKSSSKSGSKKEAPTSRRKTGKL